MSGAFYPGVTRSFTSTHQRIGGVSFEAIWMQVIMKVSFDKWDIPRFPVTEPEVYPMKFAHPQVSGMVQYGGRAMPTES